MKGKKNDLKTTIRRTEVQAIRRAEVQDQNTVHSSERIRLSEEDRLSSCSRKILSILLTGTLLLTVSGCKPSPAIRDYVYDNRTDLIQDTESKELENEKDNTDKDRNLAPQEFDQTGEDRDRERQTPLKADSEHPANDSGKASRPEQVSYAQDSAQGSQTRSNSEGKTNGDGTSSGTGTVGVENTRGTGDGDGAGSAGTPVPSGDDAKKETVSDEGQEEETPKNADSLTAVGTAAMMVEMLGGGSRLSFTSQNMKEGLSSTFLDVEKIQALWQGSGQTALDETAFQQLLDAAPKVCLEISGQNTFTEEQIARLQEAGINYTVLPAITDWESACQAVDVTAQILGTDQAQQRSQEFRKFCDEVEKFVSGKTKAYSPDGIDFSTGSSRSELSETGGELALYLSAWDASAHYSLHNENVAIEGNGVAVVQTGYVSHPVTAFLSESGIANTSALKENNYSLASPEIRYVNPVVNSLYTLSVSGGSTGAKYRQYVYTSTSLGNLGDSGFRNIITPDEETRTRLLSDGLWQSYGYQTSPHSSGYGFYDENGILVETTIHGTYNVSVMPQGAADWNAGSAESVMIPLWALWKIRGLAERSDVVRYLQEFYQTFYDHTLTEQEIRQILVD